MFRDNTSRQLERSACVETTKSTAEQKKVGAHRVYDITKFFGSPVKTKDSTLLDSDDIGKRSDDGQLRLPIRIHDNEEFLRDAIDQGGRLKMKSNQESSADIPVPESRLDQDQDLDIYDSFEMDTLSDDIPHTSRASNNSGAIVLASIIGHLPDPPRERPLANLTMDQIAESVDYVMKTLLEEFVVSECNKIVIADIFLNALKRHLQMEFSTRRPGSLYNVIEAWSMMTNAADEQAPVLSKDSIEAIVSIVFSPVIQRIDLLRKDFDILINGDQFFDASRPEITSADVDSMPLSAALGELFSPFGILEVEESTECATIDVVTDLLHMSNDISSYFQNYIVSNFVMLVSSNEPSLPESAARSLLDYLTERYSMPEPILQIASLDMAPSDTHKLRRQCARALSELYFGGVVFDENLSIIADEPVSSLELTGLLQQYHDAMTLAGDKPAPSYIASFIAQHRNKLGKTGITDISPIQILTAFCQILLDESEKNGLSRVKLTKAIRQSLDRLENDGVQPGSGDVADSNAIGYTVDVLSGLLDVMRKIVDDIAGVLIQTNVTDGFQKRPF